jgi:crossover junction endodeoxyribonuclease RusA
MVELRLTLPLPHPALSPNARVHYMRRAGLVKRAKGAAYMLALEALDGRDPPSWRGVRVSAVPWFPTGHTRDGDNFIASMKSALDGVASALGIDDSRFVIDPPPMGNVDRDNPRVEITLTGAPR